MSSDYTNSFKPDSSNVEMVWYNNVNNKLTVQYKGDRKYVYSGVPEEVYEQLTDAESVGKFLNQNIVNIYPTERVN